MSNLIIAQSKGESSHFRSELAKNSNNIFGLRCSKKRKKYYQNCVNNYAQYGSIWSSINDYIDLLRFSNFPTDIKTSTDFIQRLKRIGYYEATEAQYLTMVNSWLK